MKPHKSSIIVLATSLCAIALPAQGQGLLTANQLEWVPLTWTAGMSYNQALRAMQPGYSYYGYRFANADEILGLYGWAGITDNYNFPPILSLISLLGATSSQDGHPETFGIYAGQNVAGLDFGWNNGRAAYGITPNPYIGWVFGADYSTPSVGVWLVRDVPEPNVLWLGLAGGLLVFAGRRVRRLL